MFGGRSRRGAAGQAKRAAGLTSSTTASSTPHDFAASLRPVTRTGDDAAEVHEKQTFSQVQASAAFDADEDDVYLVSRNATNPPSLGTQTSNDSVSLTKPVLILDDDDEQLIEPASDCEVKADTVVVDDDGDDEHAEQQEITRAVNWERERKEVEACFDEALARMQARAQDLDALKNRTAPL